MITEYNIPVAGKPFYGDVEALLRDNYHAEKITSPRPKERGSGRLYARLTKPTTPEQGLYNNYHYLSNESKRIFRQGCQNESRTKRVFQV